MKEVFQIATNISSPLALAGLIFAILFFIIKQLLSKNIFPKLNRQLSFKILFLIINRLFILSLVAMILGVLGFMIIEIFKPGNTTKERLVVREMNFNEFLNEDKALTTKDINLEHDQATDNPKGQPSQVSSDIPSQNRKHKSTTKTKQIDNSVLDSNKLIEVTQNIGKDSLSSEKSQIHPLPSKNENREEIHKLKLTQFDNGQIYAGFSLELFRFHRTVQSMPLWGWASSIKTVLSYKGQNVAESILAYGPPGYSNNNVPSIERFNGEYEDFYLKLDRITYKSITQILNLIDRDEAFLMVINQRAYPFIGVLFHNEDNEYKIDEIRLMNCFDPGGPTNTIFSSSQLQSMSIEMIRVNYQKK